VIGAAHDLANRFGQRLALVERDVATDLLGAGAAEFSHLAQNGRLGQWRDRTPALEGPLGRRQGVVQVGPVRVGQVPDHRASGGIEDLLFVAPCATDKGAVDIKGQLFIVAHGGAP
jgi:hypothetical protein